MSTHPNTPRLLKAGLVLLDPDSGNVRRIVALQYNPDSLSRTLTPRSGFEENTGSADKALRLKGPPTETLKIEAEIDATDSLEMADPVTAESGIYPQLAALETILYPASGSMQKSNQLADLGTLEITPPQGPLVLFVWSKNRVLPVRLTDYSVTEEAFDPHLNPIRARVSLSLRVLSTDDFGFAHKGGSLFMVHLRQKEALAGRVRQTSLSTLGIGAIP